MRTSIVIVVLMYACARGLLAGAPSDHLVRPYEDRDWGVPGYAAFLEKKLLTTPASYGRILVLPSGGSYGEYSLSLYQGSRAEGVKLTYVSASRSVWSYLSDKSSRQRPGVHEPWQDAPLRLNRSDATLPMAAGVALRSALAAMIRRTRGEWPGGTAIALDGSDIQFSLVESGRTMTGVMTAGLSGKNLSEMRELVGLLKTYCGTSRSHQASLATRIERKAKEIATRANTAN
jgi:hypothetical protein